MNRLVIDTSQGLTRSGTLKLPAKGPATTSAESDASGTGTEPASSLSRWLQQASQNAGHDGSVAELMNLLTTIQQLFPQAAPELLLLLLHKLQPFVLNGRQLSDARSVRQQIARSGLFLEATLAHANAVLPTAAQDMKLQLFQLLALMDPARLLTLVNQEPAFINGGVKAAHGLQGSGRGGRVQAYLQCSHADQQSGVSDGQLNPWLQQQVEAVLQNLVERQLQCRQGTSGLAWQAELQFQYGEQVVGVPVSIEYHAATSQWRLAFMLELPQQDKVGIVMTISGNRIELDYQCGSVLSVSVRQRHWQMLQQAFNSRQLLLTSLNHRLVHF